MEVYSKELDTMMYVHIDYKIYKEEDGLLVEPEWARSSYVDKEGACLDIAINGQACNHIVMEIVC